MYKNLINADFSLRCSARGRLLPLKPTDVGQHIGLAHHFCILGLQVEEIRLMHLGMPVPHRIPNHDRDKAVLAGVCGRRPAANVERYYL